MTRRLRKVQVLIHVDECDDDGNVVAEMTAGQPLIVFAPDLDGLPERVRAFVEVAKVDEDAPV